MGQVTQCCKGGKQEQSTDFMDDLRNDQQRRTQSITQSMTHQKAEPSSNAFSQIQQQAKLLALEKERAAAKVEEDITKGGKDFAKGLEDHKADGGDDVKKVKNYDKLDIYQKFEKEFPFFHMDVNGYCLHIREAVILDLKNAEVNVEQNHYNQTCVSLSSLQKTFQNFESWAALNDLESSFVKLLKIVCAPDTQLKNARKNTYTDVLDDGQETEEILFDIQKIKLLGILWCDGNADEKVTELYHVLQDNQQEEIACNDKEVPVLFKVIFDFATKIVFEEAERAQTLEAEEKKQISQERIQEVQESYDDVVEEFIDNIFDENSKLNKKTWMKLVTQKEKWIVDPAAIRSKLYQKEFQ